jgi:hypothetical protein
MLASSSADTNVQFVEFLDQGGTEEQFTPVFAPYNLVIYDAAGNVLAEQTLNPNGLRAAAATGREYLVSTSAADAAFHVTGDERLTVALPRGAGQACFEGRPTPPAVSCLTWGKITKPVPINMFGTGSANGPVPPNGESDQRQPDNSIVVACPTPKAPNTRSHARRPHQHRSRGRASQLTRSPSTVIGERSCAYARRARTAPAKELLRSPRRGGPPGSAAAASRSRHRRLGPCGSSSQAKRCLRTRADWAPSGVDSGRFGHQIAAGAQ